MRKKCCCADCDNASFEDLFDSELDGWVHGGAGGNPFSVSGGKLRSVYTSPATYQRCLVIPSVGQDVEVECDIVAISPKAWRAGIFIANPGSVDSEAYGIELELDTIGGTDAVSWVGASSQSHTPPGSTHKIRARRLNAAADLWDFEFYVDNVSQRLETNVSFALESQVRYGVSVYPGFNFGGDIATWDNFRMWKI